MCVCVYKHMGILEARIECIEVLGHSETEVIGSWELPATHPPLKWFHAIEKEEWLQILFLKPVLPWHPNQVRASPKVQENKKQEPGGGGVPL